MVNKTIVVVDDKGRICIPSEICRALGIRKVLSFKYMLKVIKLYL